METTNAYGGVLSLQFAPHATAEDQKKSYQLNSTSVDTSEATEEKLQRLHRIPGKIPWQAYTIAFAELCERFSYYGMSVVRKRVDLAQSTLGSPNDIISLKSHGIWCL
jgi:hypothetical protein